MNKKTIIIIAVVGIFILLAFFSALQESQQTNQQPEEKIETTEKYITRYTWNKADTKQYKNYYYVNAGIEEDPIIQNYIELRVETKDGDLESGEYKFETDEGSFLIFMSTEPIEDFNTTEVHEEQIMQNQPFETSLEKGQYVYILQGFTNQGIVKITKK